MAEIRVQFDPGLRRSIKNKKNPVAVVPVGSIEQHGPHLPISTDSDIVTAVAKEISEKNRYMLLPTINYGVSFEHAPFFNLSIKESTLKTVLFDLCFSLSENGVKTVFIINGHHGNMKAIKNLDAMIKKTIAGKIKVFTFSYWHFMQREFDHAGFVETSLMLTISENVRMKHAKKGLATDNMTQKEISRLGKLANKSFPLATKNGVWGDPTRATKKDGQRIFSEISRNLRKECLACTREVGSAMHK